MTISRQLEGRRYFSIIVGAGCNAACPFCIAPPAMKDAEPLPLEEMARVARLARRAGAEVASVSGGGEPLMLERIAPSSWEALLEAVAPYPKRDLHSNFSITPRLDLLPAFTHVTVSLWKDRETTRAYLGRDFHEKIVANLKANELPLRLSAVMGRDWCRGPADISDYVALARELGAEQVTLREMQAAPHSDIGWMDGRRIGADAVEPWLAELGDPTASTVRESPVYVIDGVEVCAYRYAPDAEDVDFVYFRPDASGTYGLFTDYDNDDCRVT